MTNLPSPPLHHLPNTIPDLPQDASQPDMEVQITPETRAALEADTTLRFLIRAKFNLDSRHSQPAIAWAESLAKAVSSAMLKSIGRKAAIVVIQMNMVQLLNIRGYALVCFDLIFEECNERAQSRQPIHLISKRGTAYHVRRNKRLDATVAAEYTRMHDLDKGPRPYFADTKHPPVYDEGIRLERPLGSGDPEKDEPQEDESEEEGPVKENKTAEDPGTP